MARITSKNIAYFQETILKWFEENGRSFPWRNKKLTHYQIVISEALLQRTRAETVSKFYRQFIKEFPSWAAIAYAEDGKVEDHLKPIGLYRQRARRLKLLAAEMIKRNGKLPKEREDLESIPFMGQYIANAVELIIHNKPSPLIDVNMARVLERYFGERKMADIRYDSYLQDLSFKVVNHKRSKEINWAIIDFAAIVCKSQKPDCNICLLSNSCKFATK